MTSSLPVLGASKLTGMSGHGFKFSPAVGEMMAAMITGTAPR
jgi:glycine/D-amino acid oxidase-like deaminating enzyme